MRTLAALQTIKRTLERSPAGGSLAGQRPSALPAACAQNRDSSAGAAARRIAGLFWAAMLSFSRSRPDHAILVRDVASGTAYAESRYQVEPARDGTRLALTTRVAHPSATKQDLDAQAAALAGRYKTTIEARLK